MPDLKKLIRTVPDFPKPGVQFKDITTLLRQPDALRYALDKLSERYRGEKIDLVLGIESRGFILAVPLAYQLRAGFVPVRKEGKLPWDSEREEYELEYGTAVLEVHKDAIRPGERVLIVDDVLATGGTARATARLVERLGGKVVGVACLIELSFLKGRQAVADYDFFSLISF